MITMALIGESGTGKSHRAIWLAGKKGLDCIIDDGILVHHSKILAGSSAKKEKTKIGAVKRAIFEDAGARTEMITVLSKYSPNGILVLATSRKMAEIIRTRLMLPEFSEVIQIEDIASKSEIAVAQEMRMKQGKHVIPVPIPEIRKTFSGYFLDPLGVFRKSRLDSDNSDKSIVRPSFSYMGDFEINDTVLCSIARFEASKEKGAANVFLVTADKTPGGLSFNIFLDMTYGTVIPDCASNIRRAVKTAVENYTSVYTAVINIHVRSLVTK